MFEPYYYFALGFTISAYAVGTVLGFYVWKATGWSKEWGAVGISNSLVLFAFFLIGGLGLLFGSLLITDPFVISVIRTVLGMAQLISSVALYRLVKRTFR